MARRGRKRVQVFDLPDRVVVRRPIVPLRSALQLVEDRREFHPDGLFRAARSLFMRSRIVPVNVNLSRKAARFSGPPVSLGFDVPRDVAVCVRRKERREVIMAKRLKRGKGGGNRRNWFSDIHC